MNIKKFTLMLTATAIATSTMAQGVSGISSLMDREMQNAERELDVALREVQTLDDDLLSSMNLDMRMLDLDLQNTLNELSELGELGELSEVMNMFDHDDDDDDNHRHRRAFRTEDSWNLEVGLNNYMTGLIEFPGANDEPYTLDTWGSHYIAITRNYSTKLLGPLYMEYGASVSWYNFQFQDSETRVNMEPDGLVFWADSSNIVPIRSKIQAPYINLHFVPVFDLSKGTLDRSYQGKGLRFGAGVYAGYRIGGRTKYVFEENGDKQKWIDKDNYYLEDFRYGVRGQLGFRGLDLFVNYDLNEVFAANRGPALNAVSFGIIL